MKKIHSLFVVLFLLLGACSQPVITDNLPRSATPEEEGVSSEWVLKYIDAVAKAGQEIHSLMIVRHGKVAVEGWWSPYSADQNHILNSVSKSFTSTAIGFAVTEKKLTVNDKVISFFPDDLPDSISPYLAELEVKDLLTMSAGHATEMGLRDIPDGSTWVKAFLAHPIEYKPGTRFLYNTPGSYMLSAIIQKVTGEKLIDYLTPRLFEPLAIKGATWMESPQGINTGGFGLEVKTEDMAKLGQLYLQKGKWNGKQILPATWIEEATRLHINQIPAGESSEASQETNDWVQGYGYQFWRCRHNAYRADGANGQFIVILPEKDAVIVTTAHIGDMQAELNLIWDYLLPALQDTPLPVNKQSGAALKAKLTTLVVTPKENR